jgi:hypothetical protein
MGSTPPQKDKGKVVYVTNSDEESASSSCIDRLRSAATAGDKDSPTSGDEDDGDVSVAANGG